MMGCTSSQAMPPGGNAIVDATSTDPKNLVVDNSNPEATKTAEVSSDDKYPPAEAFEISLDDVDNDNDDERSDSLIKKHPPKRLQKLVEQAATAVPATTIEHLEEKLAKAEVRRQQYIQQRIENIITLTSKGGGNGGEASDAGGENEGNEHDDDLNDGQKDAEAAVIVSTNTITTTSTTITTTNNSTSSSTSSSNSSQNGDVVVQPTASPPPLKETSVSVDKKHIDGDHQAQGGADNGTHP